MCNLFLEIKVNIFVTDQYVNSKVFVAEFKGLLF